MRRWEIWKGGEVVRWQGGKVGVPWFYSRVGDAGRVQDFIFLFLMLIKGAKGRDEFKIFLRGRSDGKTLPRSSASR